jgi:cold-inducible RNA-binding protein
MNNIYVGNLSYSTTEATLRELFSEFGEVTSVKVITDKLTGNPRGFAFVEMASPEEAKTAIAELNGKEVDGKQLKISEARPRENRPAPRGGNRRY